MFFKGTRLSNNRFAGNLTVVIDAKEGVNTTLTRGGQSFLITEGVNVIRLANDNVDKNFEESSFLTSDVECNSLSVKGQFRGAYSMQNFMMNCGQIDDIDVSLVDTRNLRRLYLCGVNEYCHGTFDCSNWDVRNVIHCYNYDSTTGLGYGFLSKAINLDYIDLSNMQFLNAKRPHSGDTLLGILSGGFIWRYGTFLPCNQGQAINTVANVANMQFKDDGSQSLAYSFTGYLYYGTMMNIIGLNNIKGKPNNLSYFLYGSAITNCRLPQSFTNYCTDFTYMFQGCSSLTSLDLSGLDFSSGTNFGSMFDSCTGLTSLDLSGLDFSSGISFNGMFHNCTGLTSLDLSGCDFSNGIYFGYMFQGCSSLTSLDLSGLDFSSGTNFPFMFNECSSLTSLDLSGLDFSSGTNFNRMFSGCTGLTSLDLSSLDFSSGISFSGMFNNCTGLTSLDLSGCDFSSGTDFSSIFYGCSSLTSLDLSSLDFSSGTNFFCMFNKCSSLTSLDLSGLDFSSGTNFMYTFSGCTSLTTLDLSDCDLSNATNTTNMFQNCTALTTIYAVGCNATTITKLTAVKPSQTTIVTTI